MAGTVKGLTVEIGGEVTQLSRAMREVGQEARSTESELRKVDRMINQLGGNNVTLLAQKQELLNKAVGETTTRLHELQAMQRQLDSQGGARTDRQQAEYRALAREIEAVRVRLVALRAEQIAFASGSAAAASLGASMTQLGQNIDATISKLTALGVGIGVLGGYAVNASIAFESSFAGVRKTVDATEEQFQGLAQAAREMALTKPIDVNDVNLIMELGGQLGIARESLVDFASVVADLNVSTDLGVEDAATDLARFANITGMAADDFDRFGATIVALGNNSAATESEIAEFAMRLSGAAAAAGFSESAILAVSAAMASVGLNAEAGGTAMSRLITDIDKSVALGTESLTLWAETAGMSAAEFTEAWRNDPPQALNAVIDGITRFSDAGGSLAVKLEELDITEIRQSDTVRRLANAHGLMARELELADQAWADNTALTNEASQRYATTESQLQILKNRLQDAAITLGDQLKPALVEIGRGLVDFAAGAMSAIGSIAQLTSGFSGVGLAMVAAVAASGKITTMLGGAVTAIGNLGTAFAKTTAQIEAGTYATVTNQAKTALNTTTTGLAAVAKNLAAAAEAKLAASTAVGTAATIANTTATGALSTVQKVATMAQIAFNAAVEANPIGLVLLAIVAAVSAIGALVNALSDAVKGTNELTEASKEQQKAVEEAQAAYDEAVEAHGEMSEEALKAKAALDEETAAFEKSKQTLEQMREETESMLNSHNELMDSMRDAVYDAGVEGAAMLNLVDQLKSLAAQESKSADDKERLAAIVDQLNAKCQGLNLTYDKQTDTLNMTADAIEKIVRAEGQRLRGTAAYSRYNDLIKEQLELEDQYREVAVELATKMEQMNSNTLNIVDQMIVTKQAEGLYEDLNKLKAAIDQNRVSQEQALDIYTKTQARQSALADAAKKVADGYMTAELAANLYSDGLSEALTAEEVAAQATLLTIDVLQQQADNFAEIQGKVQDLANTIPGFSDAMHAGGMSVDDLAQRLSDAGISADEFGEDVKSLVEVTTNGFSEMKQATDISLDEYIANLQERQVATLNWSNNIQALYAQAGSGSERAFIDYLSQLGPEYSNFVQQIIDENRLPEVAAQWADGGYDAGTAYTGNLEAQVNSGAPAVDAAVDNITANMEAQAAPAAAAGDQAGQAYSESMAGGVQSGTGPVQDAAQGLANATEAAAANNGNAWWWGNDLGQQLASGIMSTISSVSGAAFNIASTIASFIHFSLPDQGPLKDADEFMPDFVAVMAQGMKDSTPMLLRSADELAKGVSDKLDFTYGFSEEEQGQWRNPAQLSQAARQQSEVSAIRSLAESMAGGAGDVNVYIDQFVANSREDIDYFSEQLAMKVNRGRSGLRAS